MSLNDSVFTDKKLGKLIEVVANKHGLDLNETRQIVRTFFAHIYGTISTTTFIDDKTDEIITNEFYLRVPYLFSFQLSKKKLYHLKKYKDSVRNDKEPV